MRLLQLDNFWLGILMIHLFRARTFLYSLPQLRHNFHLVSTSRALRGDNPVDATLTPTVHPEDLVVLAGVLPGHADDAALDPVHDGRAVKVLVGVVAHEAGVVGGLVLGLRGWKMRPCPVSQFGRN